LAEFDRLSGVGGTVYRDRELMMAGTGNKFFEIAAFPLTPSLKASQKDRNYC